MNWDRIEGKWKQMKGNVKQRWGDLTDDELDRIAGKRDQLVGKIQEQYGIKDLPVAEKMARQVISLPVHPLLTEAELDAIVQAVNSL